MLLNFGGFYNYRGRSRFRKVIVPEEQQVPQFVIYEHKALLLLRCTQAQYGLVKFDVLIHNVLLLFFEQLLHLIALRSTGIPILIYIEQPLIDEPLRNDITFVEPVLSFEFLETPQFFLFHCNTLQALDFDDNIFNFLDH